MPLKSNRVKRGVRRRWYRRKVTKRSRNESEPSPIDHDGEISNSAGPSTPCQTLGGVGDLLVVPSEKEINETDPSPIDHDGEIPHSAGPSTFCQTLGGVGDLLVVSSEVEINDNHTRCETTLYLDHDYMKESSNTSGPQTEQLCSAPTVTECMTELVLQVCQKLLVRLPLFWSVYPDETNIHVMLISRQKSICVQRSIRCASNGDLELYVHCNPIPIEPYLEGVRPKVQLSSSTVNEFCVRIMEVIKIVRVMEVCAGVSESDYCHIWSSLTHFGDVDHNPYQEWRYSKTFRSSSCLRLVKSTKWICRECASLTPILKKRHERSKHEIVMSGTRNDFLSEEQKLIKLKIQKDKIRSQRLKTAYLESKIQALIAKEGVNLDENLSNDLHEIMRSANLTPAQEMFLQQQIKSSQKKSIHGMRWHPSMIRIALSIFLNSPSTYELIRDSGIIKLPSSRTLFDYSHPDIVKEGIFDSVIRDIELKVSLFQETYKHFHVLMCDEMYTSKNLVYHKGTGELTGYMKLNNLDQEIRLLENFLDDPNATHQPEMSNKILSFLVKGVCTDIKEVVATFSVTTVSVDQFYSWTWDVIGSLERCGIKVVALVCDGSPTNRALIKKHTPVKNDQYIHEDEVIPGSAVYVTVNKAASQRNLYFICDVPHLLKTIRNCFNNSRIQDKRRKRCLQVNGEVIVWDTIVQLYNVKKDKMLRKSYKLNAQNVFPNAFSCMKVSLAAQVMSETVATNIEQQKWPETKETVHFIRSVNRWFDCLNGANTYQGRRKRNPQLEPYTDVNDARFTFLINFVQYLDDWRTQAQIRSANLDESLMSIASTLVDDCTRTCEPRALAMVDVDEDDDKSAEKSQLSHQTLLGIEITVKSFISCTRFLISQGCPFINARAFCQDPLEQHFSKLRSGFGGSTNPNSNQCLVKQNAIHIMGQLGCKRRGNTEAEGSKFEVTEEAMKKRKSSRSLAHDFSSTV